LHTKRGDSESERQATIGSNPWGARDSRAERVAVPSAAPPTRGTCTG
jgi:hypothetical protein